MKFHINAAGEAGKCKATKGNCPFGGEAEHFTSAEAAREHYEKQMGDSTSSLSKAKKSISTMPRDQRFDVVDFYDYKKEEVRLSELRTTGFQDGTIDELNVAWQDLWRARGDARDLTKNRVAAVLESGFTGSLKDAISSGVVDKGSDKKDLSDNERNAIGVISELPSKYQEKFYNLPVAYLKSFASDKPDSALPTAGMKKLLDVAEAVHAKNPEFAPSRLQVTPRAARSEFNKPGTFSIPQMQHTSPETYSLLNEYAKQKYGAQSDDFWRTVHSESMNHPKLSDFTRAEKEFDKKLKS